MDLTKKYRLKKDVVSYMNPGFVYGKSGTEVTILHDHLDMMIVQDEAGNKFHSRTDNLAKLSEPIDAQVTVKPVEQNKSTGRSQRKKAAPAIIQPNLF